MVEFFYKSAKTVQEGKESSFQQIILGHVDNYVQKTKVGSLTPYKKSTQNGSKTQT